MFDHPMVPVPKAPELEAMGYKIVTFPFTSTLAQAKTLDLLYPSMLKAQGTAHLNSEKMDLHAFEAAMELEQIWQDIKSIQKG